MLGALGDFDRDSRQLVGYDRDSPQLDSDLSELACGEVGIAVLHLTGQDLISDHHHRRASILHTPPALSSQQSRRGKVIDAEASTALQPFQSLQSLESPESGP